MSVHQVHRLYAYTCMCLACLNNDWNFRCQKLLSWWEEAMELAIMECVGGHTVPTFSSCGPMLEFLLWAGLR